MARQQSQKKRSGEPALTQGWFDRLGSWAVANHDVLIPVALALAVFGLVVTRHAIPSLIHDAYSYTMASLRLVRDGVYAFAGGEMPGSPVPPDARVTPGYVLFLSAFYSLFGRTGDVLATVRAVQPMIVGVQYALAVGTVAFLALCGRELGGKRLGFVTGILAAFYLPFAWASLVTLCESLAVPLLSAQLWWALRLTRRDASRHIAELFAFGLFSAIIAMVRPAMILWILVPLAYALLARLESWRRLVLLASVAALGFALVFTPWWIRNTRMLGEFVPLRTDLVRGADGELVSIATDAPPHLAPSQWLQVSFMAATSPWAATDEVLWENKFHYDKMRIEFGQFPASIQDRLLPMVSAMYYYHYALLAAAVAALFFARRSPRLLIVATVPLYAVGVHLGTQVTQRYAYLGAPALIVMAGAGVYGVWHLATRGLRARRT